MAITVAISNQKGGCGKTTTSIELSNNLAVNKIKTLLIDFDPQHSSTNALEIRLQRDTITAYEFVTQHAEARIEINEYLDFIPSANTLQNITSMNDLSSPEMLREALMNIEHEYDVILIDCPPLITQLTHNCYAAADRLLIPIYPGTFSIEGLAQLKDELIRIRRMYNPDLDILGFFLTNVDKNTNAEKDLINDASYCEEHLETKRFGTIIYHSTCVNDAQKARKPLAVFRPKAKVTIAYDQLIDEIKERLHL